ncbi:MAG: DUF2141 domain-containing protein [Rhodospirillales bacterium]|nr:DUF2141 domain-containing protein [Rhodospirillales bacterium]MSP80144.1 DUF2141 domain-containing protein [Rhodospirillales bacterium]
MPRFLFGARAFAVAALLATPASARAADLAVEVRALRSDQGNIRVGLFASPETFATDAGKIAEIAIVPRGGVARGAFADIAPGTYAIAAYHDENANRIFDRGLFGGPLEGYGFSNDAPAFLGAPTFARAAFTVPANGAAVVLRMVYW